MTILDASTVANRARAEIQAAWLLNKKVKDTELEIEALTLSGEHISQTLQNLNANPNEQAELRNELTLKLQEVQQTLSAKQIKVCRQKLQIEGLIRPHLHMGKWHMRYTHHIRYIDGKEKIINVFPNPVKVMGPSSMIDCRGERYSTAHLHPSYLKRLPLMPPAGQFNTECCFMANQISSHFGIMGEPNYDGAPRDEGTASMINQRIKNCERSVKENGNLIMEFLGNAHEGYKTSLREAISFAVGDSIPTGDLTDMITGYASEI